MIWYDLSYRPDIDSEYVFLHYHIENISKSVIFRELCAYEIQYQLKCNAYMWPSNVSLNFGCYHAKNTIVNPSRFGCITFSYLNFKSGNFKGRKLMYLFELHCLITINRAWIIFLIQWSLPFSIYRMLINKLLV